MQSSDFALPNFRYLWRLVLVEGRQNHIRITKFIFVFLYKNSVFTLAQFFYGFYCNFSATSLYDDWYIIMYNILFTACTISYLGIVDQDIRLREYAKEKAPEPQQSNPPLETERNLATETSV